MKIKFSEPRPKAIYSPISMKDEYENMGIKWLGDTITVRYRIHKFTQEELDSLNLPVEIKARLNTTLDYDEYQLRVTSAPFCRLYWGNRKPEFFVYESAWKQRDDGKWVKPQPNYLSYEVIHSGDIPGIYTNNR